MIIHKKWVVIIQKPCNVKTFGDKKSMTKSVDLPVAQYTQKQSLNAAFSGCKQAVPQFLSALPEHSAPLESRLVYWPISEECVPSPA